MIAYESVQGTSNGLQVFSEGGSLGKSGFTGEEVLLLNLDRYLLIILMQIISGETVTNAYGNPDFKFGEIVVGVNKNQKLGSIAEGVLKVIIKIMMYSFKPQVQEKGEEIEMDFMVLQ